MDAVKYNGMNEWMVLMYHYFATGEAGLVL